jgi:hypothetical protein
VLAVPFPDLLLITLAEAVQICNRSVRTYDNVADYFVKGACDVPGLVIVHIRTPVLKGYFKAWRRQFDVKANFTL